jgi:hypothetical protein
MQREFEEMLEGDESAAVEKCIPTPLHQLLQQGERKAPPKIVVRADSSYLSLCSAIVQRCGRR